MSAIDSAYHVIHI